MLAPPSSFTAFDEFGARSDLAHFEPSEADTEDVQAVHKEFAALQARWLDELKSKAKTH